jgi:hypothetical protein
VEEVTEEVRNERDPKNRELKFGRFRIPDYFLNVAIQVKPGSLAQFEAGMRSLTDDFKWEFIAAGEFPPPPDIIAKEAEPEIMHLWKFGNANNLYQQMVELRENQRFAHLEQFTSKVIHILMCDWEALSRTKRPPPLIELSALT